jgi:hypothetical protein
MPLSLPMLPSLPMPPVAADASWGQARERGPAVVGAGIYQRRGAVGGGEDLVEPVDHRPPEARLGAVAGQQAQPGRRVLGQPRVRPAAEQDQQRVAAQDVVRVHDAVPGLAAQRPGQRAQPGEAAAFQGDDPLHAMEMPRQGRETGLGDQRNAALGRARPVRQRGQRPAQEDQVTERAEAQDQPVVHAFIRSLGGHPGPRLRCRAPCRGPALGFGRRQKEVKHIRWHGARPAPVDRRHALRGVLAAAAASG